MKRLRKVFYACVAGMSLTTTGCATIHLQGEDLPPLPRVTAQDISAADAHIAATAHEYARLATRPYHAGETAWELAATSRALIGRTSSGFDAAVFQKDGKCAAVFYGYNAGNDLIDVVKAGFFGVPRAQLRDAMHFTGKAAEACGVPASEMDIVGHSLGGYLAKAVATQTKVSSVWAFNSPGFKRRDPARIERILGGAAQEAEVVGDTPIYNFNARFDVVGKWGFQPGTVYEVDTPNRHHALSSMAEALRRDTPDAAAAAEADTPAKKSGIVSRTFNRIANSDFVQKKLYRAFRRPERPVSP